MTPFEQVAVDARCLDKACEKQGCTMSVADAPRPFHLIDMDHQRSPAVGGQRCDYLFVAAGNGRYDLYVVPLELKSSGFRPASVAAQLSGGARTAENVVPNTHCRFVPVVAHAGAHRKQINELAKHAVRFHGREYAIRAVRCGERIADVISVP